MSQIFGSTSGGGGGGSPGGSSPQIQFNNAGAFGGTANLEFDSANAALRGLTGLTRGFELFNTADITTNTERLRMYWTSSVAVLSTDTQGTGTQRELTIGTFTSGSGRNRLRFFGSGTTTEIQSVSIASSVAGSVHFSMSPGSFTAASGTQTALQIAPTVNQSGTAGYTSILVNTTETTTGSGTKNLLNLQVGGASRFRVDNTGAPTISSAGVATGLRLFNTADEVTNLEVLGIYWTSNIATIATNIGGTGGARQLRLMSVGVNYLDIMPGFSTGCFRFSAGSVISSTGSILQTASTFTNSSGAVQVANFSNTYNQSGTASSTDIFVNRTETALGSGNQRFMELQVGGASRYSITNLGIPLYTPSATQSLLAANAISKDRGMIKVQGNGGAVTLTSAPTIAAGVEGEVIFIVGQSNTNTVTVQDRGTLASSNLRLATTTRTLGNGDVLALVYDGALWSEMYYSNNL